MTKTLAAAVTLGLLITACVASGTTEISQAELRPSDAPPSSQDDPAVGQTPTPTPPSQPAPRSTPPVVNPDAFPLMSAQDWCAGPGKQLRELMLFTSSSDDLEPLVPMVDAARSTITGSPPEIADAVYTAVLALDELYEIVLVGNTVSIFEDDPDYWASRTDFFDALFDIEEYNLDVCGLDPARGLRPTPTPTPDLALEEFWILVEELLEEGFTSEQSRCLANRILDEDPDLDDDTLLQAMLDECLA